MKYFHKASNTQIEKLFSTPGMTYVQLSKEYKEPEWCKYGPEALHGQMGCWSLMDIDGLRKRISPKFCQGCECYKPKPR